MRVTDAAAAKPDQTSIHSTLVTRWQNGRRQAVADVLAVEEPCEIRLDGEPVAVVMRTPDHDDELAAGFLCTEGIIASGDIAAINDEPQPRNIVDVLLADGVQPRRGWQRNFYASSSCGICGIASIHAVQRQAPPLPDGARVSRAMLSRIGEQLRDEQTVFAATGGLHGAALFDVGGRLIVVREDIGRHNAVDKIIGYAFLRDALPLANRVLLVSGRTSFEIVQKALMARIPIVAGVSAASSLAVKLAAQSNITLIGFLRGERMNVYTGAHRIR